MAAPLIDKGRLVGAELNNGANITYQTSLAGIAALTKIPIYLGPIHASTSTTKRMQRQNDLNRAEIHAHPERANKSAHIIQQE
jgi:hypothetical protein